MTKPIIKYRQGDGDFKCLVAGLICDLLGHVPRETTTRFGTPWFACDRCDADLGDSCP